MKNHTVIICEKKSVAYILSKALSVHIKEREGFLVDEEKQFYYTWAQGHLLTLEMKDSGKEWNWDNLPIIPTSISLKPLPGAAAQLNVISRLTKDCKLIVNAMDSGPEGSLIYIFLKIWLGLSNTPTKRFWTTSLQTTAIKDAFANMKNDTEYKHLQNMAITRALSDLIIGINSSRCITLLGNNQQTFSIGRVVLACLGLLYDREVERNSFEPETYYKIKGAFVQEDQNLIARYVGPRLLELDDAKEIVNGIGSQKGALEWNDKVKEKVPPPLFNLTDICVIANQQLNLPPKVTTSLLQSLYMKKLISYPRTSSRYVTPNEYVQMRAAYRLLSIVYPNLKGAGDIDRLNIDNPLIFHRQLPFDHHAIIPEVAVPTEFDSIEEKAIYHLIVERLLVQFCEPHKYVNRKVTLKFDSGYFETTYKQIIVPGWKGIDLNFKTEIEETVAEEEIEEVEVSELPLLKHGAPVNFVAAEITDKVTSPPSLYTEGSLMRQMESVSNLVKEKELKEALKNSGIGTSATRAETIHKLKKLKYITIDKKKIELTKLGKKIVQLVRDSNASLITSPQFTGEWERSLEEIKEGKSANEFHKYVVEFTTQFIEEMKEHKLIEQDLNSLDCSCPKCGGSITTHKKMYRCSKKECSFILWKTQFGKTISPSMLTRLIAKGETSTLTFKTKNGQRSYKAKLKMPEDLSNGKLLLEYVNN